MFPSTFYNLFPAFPKTYNVFVAMSFDSVFDFRWKNVILPAVEGLKTVNNTPLNPKRVDTRKVSDSIITEILTHISDSLVIIGDISVIHKEKDMVFRNANVMYELGLAHAVRQPEEIILFRSDNESLPFDTANVRVNSYDPDKNPIEAIKIVQNAIIDSFREINHTKNLAVIKAAETLDFLCWITLLNSNSQQGMNPPPPSMHLGTNNAAINKLLELGAIKCEYQQLTPEFIKSIDNINFPTEIIRYKITQFGQAVLAYLQNSTKWSSPENSKAIAEKVAPQQSNDKQ